MGDPYNAWRRNLLAIHALLDSLSDHAPKDKNLLRAEVIQVAEALNLLRKAGMYRFTKARGARTRILEYLKQFVGEAITGDELEVVSGIHEYPRRIRELRVQDGYGIATGLSREDLKRDEYVLERESSDPEQAANWKLANRIRRMKGSGQSRMLALLKAKIGQRVSSEQLLYVGRVKDMRRVRELRTEHGWRITTRYTGQPDLPPGYYILETAEQAPPHDRKIDPVVYDEVLERDRYACRKCGWTVKLRHPGAKRQFIELHHVEHHKDGGSNNKENLVTLCNVCHDEAHRRGVDGGEFFEWMGGAGVKAP